MADGIACCAACASCAAAVIPGAREYEPGRHLAVIHIGHAGQLEAQGWRVVHGMYGDEGTTDVTTDVICPHLAATLET